MNREQRRKQKPKGRPHRRKKSKSEIFSLEMLTSAFLWQLHNDFGFGQKRLQKILESVKGLFEDQLDRGEITLLDLHTALKEECGVDVDFSYNHDEEDERRHF